MNGSLQQAGWRVIEHMRVVTPLAIRFWDPALDTQVTDGLIVTARLDGSTGQPRRAFRTASGVYAFRNLPGLHDFEYPESDAHYSVSLPAQRRFLIEVNDGDGRFLPVTFHIDAPIRGVFPTQSATSLGDAPPGFFLFSASTRATTPVLVAVHAELRERLDDTRDQPAAYALLEVDTPAGMFLGLADERGVVAVVMPYPVFTVVSGGSGSMPSLPASAAQSWDVSVRVFYQPSALFVPPGARLPEFRSVLAQASGTIWTRRAVPPGEGVGEISAKLVFDQELVLRSEQESVLLVGPGSLP